MYCSPLSYLISIPLAGALLALLVPRRLCAYAASAGAFANALAVAWLIKAPQNFSMPWAGTTWALKLDMTAAVMLSAAALATLGIVLYAADQLEETPYARTWHVLMLAAAALVNGALLSDSLTQLLFFWEALLLPLFGMIVAARPDAYKTAVKSFVIVGIADLFLMFGMGLLEHASHQHYVSGVHVAVGTAGIAAFICMLTGTLAKAGSVPFHSWIPDAADETPLAFTLAVPSALGRILGVYLLIRMLTYQFFFTSPWTVRIVIGLGAVTAVWGIVRILAQQTTKRALAYASIAATGICFVVTGALFSDAPTAAALFTGGLTVILTGAFILCGTRESSCSTALARMSTRAGSVSIITSLNARANDTRLDPYTIGMAVASAGGRIALRLDRIINWVYDGLIPFLAVLLSTIVRLFHTGNYTIYILWSLTGTVVIIAVLLK